MAITLLKFALALLIAAQGPNVPQDLKTQAINVANQAIVAAQAEIIAESAAPVVPVTTTEVTPVQATPAIGGIGAPALPAPTCTLTAQRVHTALQDLAIWQWTTENATEGYVPTPTGYKALMTPIEAGSYGNAGGSGLVIPSTASTTLTANVTGAGGTASCQATI